MIERPPLWARWLADRWVRDDDREFVLGDLEQMYTTHRASHSLAVATLRYLGWVLRSGSSSARRRSLGWLTRDAQQALRQFRRAPRVHIGAAVVLSAGLGVATFAWGIYYAEQLRPLQVDGGERMAEIGLLNRETGQVRPALAIRDIERLRPRTDLFDAAVLTGASSVQLGDRAGPPIRTEALFVSPAMFDLLEVTPALGRTLVPGDAGAGAAAVAVLSYDFWHERYAGAPDVVGRSIRIGGEPTVIVGVLPEAARYLGADPLWLPIRRDSDVDALDWTGVVRLTAGVEPERVRQALDGLSRGVAAEFPELRGSLEYALLPFGYGLRGPHMSTYTRVLAWVGILLYLMAVSNVANLFLVRARARSRELAVRRALGAGTAGILRQLGVEAAGPAILGLVGGAVLAGLGLRWYQGAATVYGGGTPGPIWVHYGIERPHIWVLAAGAIASTVLVSLSAGAWELGRSDAGVLRAKRSAGGDFRLGKGLLAVEVAAGGTLILLATLLLQGAWNLRTVDYGFETASVLTGTIELEAYPDDESRLAFYQALEDELQATPGVQSVALATQLPMIRFRGMQRVEIEGWDWDGVDSGSLPRRYADFVSPDFFETFGRLVVDGRAFASTDGLDDEPVALVNEPFAQRHFANESPIGKRVRVWRGSEAGPWRRIVGVAPHLWMDTDVNAFPEGIYVPMVQAPAAWTQIGVRVDGAPEDFAQTLRDVVARLDPELPVLDVQTMPELIRHRTRLYRFQNPPFIAVGLAAFFLALGGLYAVASYLASLRGVEFGVRSSLGAPRRQLAALAVRGVALPSVVGIVVGVGFGMMLVRDFDRLLFMVEPWSPLAIGLSVGVMMVGAMLSALPPALRASRVDLVSVLKAE